ncbi:hypothetical protein GVAV_001278 [Gurleya vavrai]
MSEEAKCKHEVLLEDAATPPEEKIVANVEGKRKDVSLDPSAKRQRLCSTCLTSFY